jgi:hypothetical protein
MRHADAVGQVDGVDQDAVQDIDRGLFGILAKVVAGLTKGHGQVSNALARLTLLFE